MLLTVLFMFVCLVSSTDGASVLQTSFSTTSVNLSDIWRGLTFSSAVSELEVKELGGVFLEGRQVPEWPLICWEKGKLLHIWITCMAKTWKKIKFKFIFKLIFQVCCLLFCCRTNWCVQGRAVFSMFSILKIYLNNTLKRHSEVFTISDIEAFVLCFPLFSFS